MNRLTRSMLDRFRTWLLRPALKELAPSPAQQRLPALLQQQLLRQIRTFPPDEPRPIADSGFGLHSQFEEDGILLYLFALLGMGRRRAVEICAGDGIECNAANLILHHGWHALLVDGDATRIETARAFYGTHAGTRYWGPVLAHAWVTAENVNELVRTHGFDGEVDLLSLDLDGNDLWIWRALTALRPRVVVAEVNHLWGPERSVSVPYDPQFRAEFTSHGSDYAGASLAAFVKLGHERGYRLVGTNRFATNAFFVRSDLTHPALPEVAPAACFDHPRAEFGRRVRFPKIQDRPWVEY